MQRYLNYLLLVLIALIWGSQFVLIKTALQSFPPLTLAMLRALTGAIALSILLLFFKSPSADEKTEHNLKSLCYIFCIGFFEATLPFMLISWGQQHTATSIAAILISTIPIFTIIFLAFFVKHEVLTVGKYLSVVIGFVGILVLLVPNAMQNMLNGTHNIMAELAILGGACSFAISLIMIRRVLGYGMVALVRNVLLSASIQLLPFALIFNHPWKLHPSLIAIGAIIVLGVVASGIVYILYVVLLKRTGAAFTSLNNYLIPLVGVALGIIVMHEHIHWNFYVAFIILIIAMLTNEITFSHKRRKSA